MALPQEINEGAWFELSSLRTLLQAGLGLRACSGQGFCAHLDTCKKGDITSPKTSISGRGEE